MVIAEDSQVYRDLLRMKPDGLSPNAWAVKAGVSRTVWADMRRHGNPSRRTLAKLLDAAGSSLAEFEALAIGGPLKQDERQAVPSGVGDVLSSAWGSAQLPPLPLLTTFMAGEWDVAGRQIELTGIDPGRVVDRLPRPQALAGDGDAYGLTIVGDSMWPRFRPGRRIFISPKAPVAIGDDVVVQLSKNKSEPDKDAAWGTCLIKELVRRSAGFVKLRQFTPDVTFRLEARDIAAIHKVIGEVF